MCYFQLIVVSLCMKRIHMWLLAPGCSVVTQDRRAGLFLIGRDLVSLKCRSKQKQLLRGLDSIPSSNYVLFIAVMCAHPHLSSPPGPWWWRWCWSPRSRCRRWWAPGYHECQCRHPSILTIKILELGEASFLWSVQLHTLLREFVWCLHTWMPPAE